MRIGTASLLSKLRIEPIAVAADFYTFTVFLNVINDIAVES
jgi:hypothetical protein